MTSQINNSDKQQLSKGSDCESYLIALLGLRRSPSNYPDLFGWKPEYKRMFYLESKTAIAADPSFNIRLPNYQFFYKKRIECEEQQGKELNGQGIFFSEKDCEFFYAFSELVDAAPKGKSVENGKTVENGRRRLCYEYQNIFIIPAEIVKRKYVVERMLPFKNSNKIITPYQIESELEQKIETRATGKFDYSQRDFRGIKFSFLHNLFYRNKDAWDSLNAGYSAEDQMTYSKFSFVRADHPSGNLLLMGKDSSLLEKIVRMNNKNRQNISKILEARRFLRKQYQDPHFAEFFEEPFLSHLIDWRCDTKELKDRLNVFKECIKHPLFPAFPKTRAECDKK